MSNEDRKTPQVSKESKSETTKAIESFKAREMAEFRKGTQVTPAASLNPNPPSAAVAAPSATEKPQSAAGSSGGTSQGKKETPTSSDT